ncbi:MAG: type VI secretion system protein TssA [Polyangiaceae bacterium]|jgi:type VI secretion system protein ImpA
MFDLQGLLQPLEQGEPSGPNLRYSPEYIALERALEGKPERQMGATIVPAEPPDWRSVHEQCVGLLRSSRDLRLAVTLARAEAELHGFSGFAEAMRLIVGLVTTQWQTLHPRLDEDDDNDATARVSAMSELMQRHVLQALRNAPLAVSPAFGPISLRSVELAAASKGGVNKSSAATVTSTSASPAGTVGSAPTASGLTMAAVDAAFQHTDAETMTITVERIAASIDQVQNLSTVWAERLPGAGPDFSELRSLLKQAHQAVLSHLEVRQVERTQHAPPAENSPRGAVEGIRGDGEIRSRDDVVRAIDAISAYYARSEPSSPVPLLLQRCRKMVTMAFTDILKELLPESLPNLQKIAGKTD